MFSGLRQAFTRKPRGGGGRDALTGLVNALLEKIRALEGRVEALERERASTVELRRLASDCMNRVTEMALVTADKDELAGMFRAQARVSEGERGEEKWEPKEDLWPPEGASLVEYR